MLKCVQKEKGYNEIEQSLDTSHLSITSICETKNILEHVINSNALAITIYVGWYCDC
jgi:hypothetical protein